MSLHEKRGLVVGIANEHSIAYGFAKAFREAGAELAITYLNSRAEPYVRPLAESLGSSIIAPCDVRETGQLEAMFAQIREKWGDSILLSTRSHMHRKRILRAASSIVRRPASILQWTYPATRLSAWRDYPNP